MKAIIIVTVAALVTGCSTYSANRYSISADNVVALRSLNGQMLNVGAFTATVPGLRKINCRAAGPIATPDGEPFSEFIRKALMDELKIAEAYSSDAPVTITGNLNSIDFSSNSGTWDIALRITSSNGKSMAVTESYDYTSSFEGNQACDQTAQALMPAVQDLIGKIVQSPKFAELAAQ